ncbi:RloB domain-containing protein [Candidatus Gracilibacteria bacterium]|nr:RloB domain-containing protein [Candidatus Gracilibacteria bacterium]
MGKFIRKREARDEFKKIYIFCEGESTEPLYFRGFKQEIEEEIRRKEAAIVIEGTGANTISLVNYAIKKVKEDGIDKNEGDEVWVVFDEDTRENGNFDNAIYKAKAFNQKKGMECSFNVAYSNECFELWYLLHFRYSTSSVGRKNYYKELTMYLNKLDPALQIESYEQQGKSLDLYKLLKPFQKKATEGAMKLEKYWKADGEMVYAKQKPITKVYHLVESLNSLKIV